MDKNGNYFIDRPDIKELIMTASTKYGVKNANLNKDQVDKLYNKWFNEQDNFLEKDEVLSRLKDMFEAEQHPIRECSQCDQLGRVCYDNDGGYSHRMSQGNPTQEDLMRSQARLKNCPLDMELLDR